MPYPTIDPLTKRRRLRRPPSAVLWSLRLSSALKLTGKLFFPDRFVDCLFAVPVFFFFLRSSLFFSLLLRKPCNERRNQAPTATAVFTYRKRSKTACDRACKDQQKIRQQQVRVDHTAERDKNKQADKNKCCRERATTYEYFTLPFLLFVVL